MGSVRETSLHIFVHYQNASAVTSLGKFVQYLMALNSGSKLNFIEILRVAQQAIERTILELTLSHQIRNEEKYPMLVDHQLYGQAISRASQGATARKRRNMKLPTTR
ncbi:jg13956 [Pararge aegeria aegeria]|uniref:Jg13956 protein n=1 Tax=Pararge aegeria aegeria TaxID=348720 RepID=A0A8S4RX51_9NEOP|nr:jg13956 [Pararge aegeria aegeria]